MSDQVSEDAIIHSVAKHAAQTVTHKAISELRRLTDRLSGDDSPLRTTWDEICAQLQTECSDDWDAYDETARQVVERLMEALPEHEFHALWLQTDAGISWACDEPEDREPAEIDPEDVIDYVTSEYLYNAAGTWTNAAVAGYWMWRFDRFDDPVALDNFWGRTELACVDYLREAQNPNAGIPLGTADVELTVDIYFPRTVPSLPAELKGRTAHPGGRNRLMLDSHVEYTRDVRTPGG